MDVCVSVCALDVPRPQVTRPASERGDVYRLMHERTAQMRGVLSKSQVGGRM